MSGRYNNDAIRGRGAENGRPAIGFNVILFGVTIVKIILSFMRLYHSTDLEVHRNWLAITYSLPISRWYVEATSIWTLDYPPLFGWFSLLLSYPASYADAAMLNVTNLDYKSPAAIQYLRLSVIVSDVLLAVATKQCCEYLVSSGVRKSSRWGSALSTLQLLLLCNVGLLIVDHIHFQYNGVLFGLLLLSIVAMLNQRYILSAFYFTVLLNAKHIFLYIAPVYFVFLLRNACFPPHPGAVRLTAFRPTAFLHLAAVVSAVFAISLGPFILTGQSLALVQRLFPFKRGLFHSYWAGNVWAVYCTVDKVLEVLLRLLGLPTARSNITTGITWDVQFAVLPAVAPSVTLALTLMALLPCLVQLWRSPANTLQFLRCLVIAALTAFLFGWHVHEKAILIPIIPLAVLAVVWQFEARVFLLLSTTGYLSLLPLIPPGVETLIKLSLFAGHLVVVSYWLAGLFDERWRQWRLPLLNTVESLYVWGMGLVAGAEVALPLLLPRLQFLPLLIVSAYCAIGFIYTYVLYYVHLMTIRHDQHKRKLH